MGWECGCRGEGSFAPRDAHPDAALASSGPRAPAHAGREQPAGRPEGSSPPPATPALQPSGLCLPSLPLSPGAQPTRVHRSQPPYSAQHPRRSSKPHNLEATHVLSWFFSILLNTGFAGPGISGKINSGGEKLTWFLGVSVFWQAVRGGVEGEFGAVFSFSFLFRQRG